jgi:hypothetical protein
MKWYSWIIIGLLAATGAKAQKGSFSLREGPVPKEKIIFVRSPLTVLRYTAVDFMPLFFENGKEVKLTHAQAIAFIRHSFFKFINTPKMYDAWANGIMESACNTENVDLQPIVIRINGDQSIYTFDQFKTILWP